MALVGNLRDFPLADFLYLVDRGYKTGRLRIRSQKGSTATLYFQKGKLVYATSSAREERLGERLVRAGKLTPEQLQQALQRQKSRDQGKPIGAILIELGYVTPEEVREHVRAQIEETVYDLLTWPEGEFAFEAGNMISPEAARLAVPMEIEELIIEGMRRIDEWDEIRELIPDPSVVPHFIRQPGGRGKGVNLTPKEWRVFARINGRNSVADIAAATGLSEFDVAKILYSFAAAGLIEVLPPRREVPEAARAAAAPPSRSLINRLIQRIRGL